MRRAEIVIAKAEALRDQGLLAEARTLLEDFITEEPGQAAALSMLGQICGYMSDHAASLKHFEASRDIESDSVQTLFGLGVEYFLTGQPAGGLEALERLIAIRPDVAIFHRYHGMCLQELGREPEAKCAFEEALRIDPDYAEAMGSLGALLLKHCHFDVAEELMMRALAIKPDMTATINDLGRLYLLQSRVPEALIQYRRALEVEPGNTLAVSNVLYSQCYSDSALPEDIAAEHFSAMKQLFPPIPSTPLRIELRQPLRIGYISNDFCLHSVAFFFEPILQNHDYRKFRIFCYSNRNAPDATTHRLMSLGGTWRNIFGASAADAARMIADDGIDLLVDLSGHTSRNRLDVCALRPAPVQATWLGYPHSTGMSQVDYYISDPVCDPPGMTDHLYSERVWRLPRTFCCYLPPTEFPSITPLPDLSNRGITFGSFNNLAKVSEATILLWAVILMRIPGSRLLLKSASLGGEATRRLIHERFAGHGVLPERVMMMAHTPSPEAHLEQYAHIDIALDTFPYHGTTTTCESLWMGVPVVTLAGRTHVSRVGATLLSGIGLPELVAASPEEYVAIAVRLACDRERLATLRHELRAMMAMAPLMDAAGVTREVEEAYLKMVCRSEASATDDQGVGHE